MDEPLSIDLFDVVATVAGAIVGMYIASQYADMRSDFVDLLIGGPAFAALHAKRAIIPSRPLAAGNGVLPRRIYLLLAISGALCLTGATLGAWLAMGDDVSMSVAWSGFEQVAWGGVALLVAAGAVDLVFLRRVSRGQS